MEHDALTAYGGAMTGVVLPLTATALLTGLNAWRAQRRDGPRPSA
jgi:hypothetical protein